MEQKTTNNMNEVGEKNVTDRLEDHERRIVLLEKEVVNSLRTKKSRSQKVRGSLKQSSGSGPTFAINEFINGGYFDTPRTTSDVLKELKKRAISAKEKSVGIALMRFVRKGVLKRGGEGTSKNPWKYKKK